MNDAYLERPALLLVDDDATFREVLGAALERRGFAVSSAADAEQALAMAGAHPPEYAVCDLRLPGENGLVLIRRLIELDPETRILMLTGYASIATAVEAIKIGAVNYLAKPVDADQIVAAFERIGGRSDAVALAQPLSVSRLEWEHIQRVLAEYEGNISACARALRMHRRTLQRKLAKRPVNS